VVIIFGISARYLRNIRKMILRRIVEQLFNPLFDLYYKYGSCVPPFKYYINSFMHLRDEDIGSAVKDYGKFKDPVCFPLPFKINYIGCYGCNDNHKPLFSPERVHKGPWKVTLADTFKEQYTDMFGKGALVELLWDLEKHNQKVDYGITNIWF